METHNITMLEEGEVVIQKVRKHYMVYVSDLVFHLFGCCMFIAIASFLSWKGGIAGSYLSLFFALLVLITWVSLFASWTLNYFDVWYITDRHIIAVNQKELLEHEEAFMEFRRIQDVFFEKNGLLETWLGYGKLRVQSAGTEQEFVLSSVHDVEAIAHSIMELRDKVNNENKVEGV